MATLYKGHDHLHDLVSPWLVQRKHNYQDKWDQMMSDLKSSTLLYVGNLAFHTTESQLLALFSTAGEIKRVIMGLNRVTKTPCGFCFIEYYTHEDARSAVHCLSGARLDERIIRVDLDPGFEEGRQYGRGQSGGQRRDEFRTDFDYGRGGWGLGKDEEEEEEAAVVSESEEDDDQVMKLID